VLSIPGAFVLRENEEEALDVPRAVLTREVRPGEGSGEPMQLMIGSRMGVHDPRGVERSPLDTRAARRIPSRHQ
jgi:hypothetical protein